MFTCPNCQERLTRTRSVHGVSWRCRSCGGRMEGVALLRKLIEPQFVNQLWQRALAATAGARGCPSCTRKMREVTVREPDGSLTLDVCAACHLVWFDPAEYERSPQLPGEKPAEVEETPVDARRSRRARRAMATAMSEQAARDERRFSGEGPDDL